MKHIVRIALLVVTLWTCNAWGQSTPAFRPGQAGAVGDTASIPVTGTAQNLNCDITAAPGNLVSYRVQIRDTVVGTTGPPVTISVGSTTSAPAVAVVGNFSEMLWDTVEIFTWPPNARISVIAPTTGSTLRCTAGYGS